MRPLDGITVVSIEQAVAAPFATRQLADLGARVIKIERPGAGDFARDYDTRVKGLSSYFVWLNRSKESLCLDLKHPEGQGLMHELIDRADVFIQNLAPGATSRFGLGSRDLRRSRPGLITCDVSGYGADGPDRDRKAYDLLIQGEAGLLSVTGTPDAMAKAGISIADIAGGMYAYTAVLTALTAQARTGEGATCEVSLFDALVEWMSHPIYYAMFTGQAPERTGATHATIAPYGSFRVRDGAVQLAIQNDREWSRLCDRVLGMPELADDPRFVTNEARVEHRSALTERIEEAFGGLDRGDALERLEDAGIATATINTVQEVMDHPQLRARDRWAEVDSPVGSVPVIVPPVVIQGAEPRFDPIPAVGQHTDAILQELGHGVNDIRRFRELGVV